MLRTHEIGFLQYYDSYEWQTLKNDSKLFVAGPIPWDEAQTLASNLSAINSTNSHLTVSSIIKKTENCSVHIFKAVSNTAKTHKSLHYVSFLRSNIPAELSSYESHKYLDAYTSSRSNSRDLQLLPLVAPTASLFYEESKKNLLKDPLPMHPVIALNKRVDTDPERVQSKLSHHFTMAQRHLNDGNNKDWNLSKIEILEQNNYSEMDMKVISDEPPIFQAGLSRCWGGRTYMEDDYCHRTLPLKNGRNTLLVPYYGIFDGHCVEHPNRTGSLFSRYVKEHLPALLNEKLGQDFSTDLAIWNSIKSSFVEVSSNAYNNLTLPLFPEGGTTATLAFFLNDHLWIGSAGDSRAILSTPNGAVALSRDPRPGLSSTSGRIPKSSLGVYNRGSEVYMSFGDGIRCGRGLAITRSLGHPMIPFENNSAGINPRPKIIKYPLDPTAAKNNFLVIASDGLWDVASSTQVSKTLQELIKDDLPCREIAQQLTQKALDAGSKDNISVLVVDLFSEKKVSRKQRCCECTLV